MTNEPSYDQQLSVDKYWAPIANQSLPGTGNPSGSYFAFSSVAFPFEASKIDPNYGN